MARKTVNVTITAEGRDVGKRFKLTEMSAAAAEDWALRAFMSIAKGGMEIPEGIPQSLAGIAILGLQALASADYATAKPLLDQMMGCIQVISSAGIVRPLMDEDIEEVATRVQLRKEVFEVHTGFFARAAALKAKALQAAEAAASSNA